MRFITHTPSPPLARFVELLWYYEAPELPDFLERVLPSGHMSLLVNLSEDALRWYDGPDSKRANRVGGAAVTGAFTEHFAIDSAEQRAIMGAQFTPGGAFAFFKPTAGALSGQHVPLDALWGNEARLLRERLLEAPSPQEKLRAFEAVLRSRAVRPLERDGAIDFALAAFNDLEGGHTVTSVTDSLGLSPKRFIQRFTEQVGLTPKRYCRVRRFQQALDAMGAGRKVVWADLALACGYYDQAHFIHDFRAFAGMTPTEYAAWRRLRNHVPLGE